MEESNLSTRTVGIRYGIIIGIISATYFLVLSLLGIDQSEGILKWLTTLFAAVFVFLAHKYYKENGDGFMSYGQGVGISFWLALITELIGVATFYIYTKFVDSNFITTIRNREMEKMVEKGISQEQIDSTMVFVDKMMNPEVMSIFAFIVGLVTIVILGLVISYFTKKENQEVIS